MIMKKKHTAIKFKPIKHIIKSVKSMRSAKPIKTVKSTIVSIIILLTVITMMFTLFTACLDQKQNKRPSDDIQGNGNNSSNQSEPEDGNSSEQNSVGQSGKSGTEEIDPVKKKIKEMTLEEKIGQMVIVGFDGYTIDDSVRAMIQDYHVSGFILYGRNVESSSQLLELINSLKRENAKNNKFPLFISVDEEGGRISRMPQEFKNLPSNRTIGQINNEELSYKVGRIIAEKTRIFGFNMNFAPVLDIDSNPENPVIGDRSFGSDEKIVSKLGVQTMKGLQSGGVIPVVKHFPGHGDTSVDSHIGLPSVNSDFERLMSFELIPFKEAIINGVDVVMTAHILLPEIDSRNPASLSEKLIADILRKQLKFDGVVVTDDITMGAISKIYSLGEAALKSVLAGTDIILISHEYDNMISVLDALRDAADSGILSQDRIDESLYRIL
jgi:beta-N-acetylhexosaminidase